MYTKKQHIARKTIITCLAFLGGVSSTIFAAAVYDASVQTRANNIFDAVKKNASTMNESDATSYYNLVRLNIKSLVEVLTVVDGKILTEIGSTLPGLDDSSLIGELTATGNIGTGNTASNTSIVLTAQFSDSSSDTVVFNPKSSVIFSWVIPQGYTECEGNGGDSSWATAMRNSTFIKIPMNVVSIATPYSISCYDSNKNRVNSNLIGFTYDSATNMASFKRNYSCTVLGQSLQVAGNCTCPSDKSYVSAKSNSCITREEYSKELNSAVCEQNGGSIGADGTCKYDSSVNSKQRVFIKFTRSLPSSEYSRAENECGIPVGGSSCTINMDWYSSQEAKSMELYASVASAPYALLQSSTISNRTFTLNPSTDTKIRFVSNPGNQVDEINLVGVCVSGGKWNGNVCQSDNANTTQISNVTTLTTSANEAKIGEGIDIIYSVSADRTCSIYAVKSGNSIKKDISAGTSGTVSYVVKESDRNSGGNLEIEMDCSNGTKKSKDVKILVENSSQIGINPNSPLEIRKNKLIELYRTILGREPDEPGLNYWINDSLTIDQVRENFLNSPEYKQKNPQ